jgi:simple sugar transport system permease protein
MTTQQDERASSPMATIDERYQSVLRRVHVDRTTGRMLFLLVLTFTFFAVLNPRVFLNPLNLQNVALASPEIGVLAIAMMLAMLTGGIDLSVVAIANLSAITISMTYTALGSSDASLGGGVTPLLVVEGILVGLLCGAVNGVLVCRVGITPILATLGTMQVWNGIGVAWTGGRTLSDLPESLAKLGIATVAGLPVLFIIFMVVAIAMGLFVSRTPGGLRTQLQGANPVAARYSGIDGTSVLMRTYMVTGTLGGLAGVLFVSRNPTASADYGASYVLLVIVIAVLGGTNPSGGFATVAGVVLATLTLQILASGFTAMRLSAYEYAIAQGVILIVVMVTDQMRWRRRRRRQHRAAADSVAPPTTDESLTSERQS